MSCYISNLPNHILETIFSKATISTLKSCRDVCKSWKHILTNPSFALLHQHGSANNNLILCLGTKFTGSNFERDIYWLEFGEFSHFNLARTWALEPDFTVDFVNSCNGLVCLCLTRFNFDRILCVSNPITGEFVHLPQLEYDKYCKTNMCGLGFSSSTDQFKAIRIFSTREDSILHAETYTFRAETIIFNDKATPRGFGTDTWRSIGIVPQYNDWRKYCWRSFNAFVNGSFHWIIDIDDDYNRTNIIYSFNFESEQFRTFLLPVPPIDHVYGYCYQYADLGVLGDSLYCSYFSYLPCDDCINLWVMKDYGVEDSWAEMLVIEHRMPFWEPRDFKVIKFFENRNILFLVDYYLWFYDAERKCYERVEDSEVISFLYAISHTPTFASIKDIMGAGGIGNYRMRDEDNRSTEKLACDTSSRITR
jgi:F-box interacting protein